MKLLPSGLAAALLALAATAAQAQAQATPAQPASSAARDLQRKCETISMFPADGLEMARRAECVLAGVIPSKDRVLEARALAKGAITAGEAGGGLMLYLAYLADPEYRVLKDGKVDEQALARQAARSIEQRKDQIEAIEGLGMASGRGQRAAGIMLAAYFHDTVAPKNVARTGAISALLQREGDHHPLLDRYAREADAVAKAGDTKASLGVFFQTYGRAVEAVRSGYTAQVGGGKTCGAQPHLKSLSSGDIQDAEYLPLVGTMVKDSYLVKGQWTEYWNFTACGEEVPLKVAFVADGWGGATATIRHNKGD